MTWEDAGGSAEELVTDANKHEVTLPSFFVSDWVLFAWQDGLDDLWAGGGCLSSSMCVPESSGSLLTVVEVPWRKSEKVCWWKCAVEAEDWGASDVVLGGSGGGFANSQALMNTRTDFHVYIHACVCLFSPVQDSSGARPSWKWKTASA